MRTLDDELEILSMCFPIRDVSGGLWFGRNNNFPDATFQDWGAGRAFARAAKEFPRLLAALREIDRIIRTPTSGTAHKGANDHFAADFEQIRKICAPYVSVITQQPTK